jgi:uncharacterized protein YbjT (DUF2867 family)
MSIAISGANGLVGSRVVAQLAARGHKVRAVVRADRGTFSSLPKVEVAIADLLKPDDLARAFAGIERAMVISSSAPDMVEVQCSFIDAARRAGVRHVVKLSGIMPELDSPFRFARMHGQIEQHLAASGLAFTQLRAGEFMPSYFRQVRNLVEKNALLLPMENARIASIDVDDLAEIAVRALTTAGHEGKIHRLTGPEALTMDEVAERLSRALGRSIVYKNVPPEQVKQGQLAAGMPPFTVDALAELFAERRRGKESQVHPDTAAILGRPATTFDEFAKRHVAIFRGEQPSPRL